ncbi:MAG: hypothetical protein QXS48_01840 [Candidatus Aenigmatarchaeota archaeon]
MKSKIFILFLIFLAVLMALFPGYSEPKSLVENMSFQKSSNFFFTFEVTSYPLRVEIIPFEEKNITVGLVADPWNLNFGIIPLSGYGRRQVVISNFEKSRVRVYFKVYGEIKPFVSFSKDNFILYSNQSETIVVFLNTSKVSRIGNYSGQIDVIVRKPNLSFLESLV